MSAHHRQHLWPRTPQSERTRQLVHDFARSAGAERASARARATGPEQLAAAASGQDAEERLVNDKWQVVRREALALLSLLRLDPRFAGATNVQVKGEHPLVRALSEVRRRRQMPTKPKATDTWLAAFTSLLTSFETTGPAASAALGALESMVRQHVISAPQHLAAVLLALRHCQVEQTDTTCDEEVIDDVLSLCLALAQAPLLPQAEERQEGVLTEVMRLLVSLSVEPRLSEMRRKKVDRTIAALAARLLPPYPPAVTLQAPQSTSAAGFLWAPSSPRTDADVDTPTPWTRSRYPGAAGTGQGGESRDGGGRGRGGGVGGDGGRDGASGCSEAGRGVGGGGSGSLAQGTSAHPPASWPVTGTVSMSPQPMHVPLKALSGAGARGYERWPSVVTWFMPPRGIGLARDAAQYLAGGAGGGGGEDESGQRARVGMEASAEGAVRLVAELLDPSVSPNLSDGLRTQLLTVVYSWLAVEEAGEPWAGQGVDGGGGLRWVLRSQRVRYAVCVNLANALIHLALHSSSPASQGGVGGMAVLVRVLSILGVFFASPFLPLLPVVEEGIKEVYLGLLHSDHMPPSVREVVLEGLGDICAREGVLLRLFSCFDCAAEKSNVMHLLVTTLCRYAAPSSSRSLAVTSSPARELALKALVAALQGAAGAKQEVGAAAAVGMIVEERRRKGIYALTVQHFNSSPPLAQRLLEAAGLVCPHAPAKQMARFLKVGTQMGISKEVLGELLGDNTAMNEAILEEFALSFDFAGLDLVAALRDFLETFKLPGESQKIERITAAFARSFFLQDEKGAYNSWDAVHILTFSVIMLNTDQHSAHVKKRMTCAEFVRNNRGTNVDAARSLAQDFPREMLEDIFASISGHEIRLKQPGPASMASAAGGVGGAGGCEGCRGGRGGDIRHRLLQGLRVCEKKEEMEARESKVGKDRGDARKDRPAREAKKGRDERGEPGMDGVRWVEVVALEKGAGEALVDGHGTRHGTRYGEVAGEAFEAGLGESVTRTVGNPLAAIMRDTSQDSSRDTSRDTSQDALAAMMLASVSGPVVAALVNVIEEEEEGSEQMRLAVDGCLAVALLAARVNTGEVIEHMTSRMTRILQLLSTASNSGAAVFLLARPRMRAALSVTVSVSLNHGHMLSSSRAWAHIWHCLLVLVSSDLIQLHMPRVGGEGDERRWEREDRREKIEGVERRERESREKKDEGDMTS